MKSSLQNYILFLSSVYVRIILYLFNKVDTIFYFIINVNSNVTFFIIDINIFAKQYCILIRFFAYLIYFPFIIIIIRFRTLNRISIKKQISWLLFSLRASYIQTLATVFVHYDFIYDFYYITSKELKS